MDTNLGNGGRSGGSGCAGGSCAPRNMSGLPKRQRAGAVVRLGAGAYWRVKVPLWRCFPPGTESNCVLVTGRGEQLEVNG